jgi:5-formyltetrahydrofolate cyclo-ligase
MNPTSKLPGGGSRSALRRGRIAAREALTAVDHATRSTRIERHLLTWFRGRRPAVVGFCWPVRAEVDLRPAVRRLRDAGWRACLPVIVGPAKPMAFRAWTPDTAMAVDRHGIAYPADGEAMRPDVLLMPVNAVDAQGYRLGYGGGYFDRTLAALDPRPIAIGIGFDLARVDSIGPEAHDIPLDILITESGVEIFR